MKYASFGLCLIVCTLLFAGCQDDSDYVLGEYAVTLTTTSSTCDALVLRAIPTANLPASGVPGRQTAMRWRLSRVGIRGDGADKVLLDILSPQDGSSLLNLTGSLQHAWLHLETSQPVSAETCEMQRLVVLSGQVLADGLTGSIRTTLMSAHQPPTCVLYAISPHRCDVTETFVAVESVAPALSQALQP